jgi:3-dehydroquinate synthase
MVLCSSPAEIAMQIQTSLGRFHLSDPAGRTCGYDVLVRSGGLAGIGEALKNAGLKSPLMIVTDENVARHYLASAVASLSAAGYQIHQAVIPAGEEHKTITRAAGLWEAFLEAGLERGSTVLALGGGVVSDLAGFAAATYLRGVRWAVAPTTLLAMVDASLGGKTGIDLLQGKNLAGAFHSPSLVLIDPQVLATLPKAEFRSGMAETLKHGIIADPHLYRICLEMDGSPILLEEMVARAAAIKVQVIRADPLESGRRAVLNLGHTIGHAVELASGYSLRHGEAVAIGLAAETRLAEELNLAEKGLAEKLRADLQKLGLPVDIHLSPGSTTLP